MTSKRLIEIKEELDKEFIDAKYNFDNEIKINNKFVISTVKEYKEVPISTCVVKLGEIAKEMMKKYSPFTQPRSELIVLNDSMDEPSYFMIEIISFSITDKTKSKLKNRVMRELDINIDGEYIDKYNDLVQFFIDQVITFEELKSILAKYKIKE